MKTGDRSTARNDDGTVGPDKHGMFGSFGGRFVPEILMEPLLELERTWRLTITDRSFQSELQGLLRDYVGRPTPLYHAAKLSDRARGLRLYFKREDLNHTGSHKINNAVGQALLAKRLGKSRVIAETGAGQHGVAIATACARFGLSCCVFMGARDVERQRPNVFRMRILGAEVRSVPDGSATLKDAMNAAFREWSSTSSDTHLAIGTAAGPHPFPAIVRGFQAVIGEEARQQILSAEGRLPDVLVAPVGGGSNAIGLFHAFRDDLDVRLVGVEAAGRGIASGATAASIGAGRPGVLHGARSMVLQDEVGQILEAHSISAGLDYPAVGPEHAWLAETGRVQYTSVTDNEALEAFYACTRLEGIIPALESAHAIAHALSLSHVPGGAGRSRVAIVNLSGRGDKDLPTLMSDDDIASKPTAPSADQRPRGFDVI